MAMFARRTLQRFLAALAEHLPVAARQKLAHELDRRSASALGFEWETALLYALNRIGQIEYEIPYIDGSRRPDIRFYETDGESICFAADVATVSDEGLEAENPVMRFSMALHRLRLRDRYNLPGVFHYDIKGEAIGPHYRDRKMRLKLPKRADMDRFLRGYGDSAFNSKRLQEANWISVTVILAGWRLGRQRSR
jgi:hypothetical protein